MRNAMQDHGKQDEAYNPLKDACLWSLMVFLLPPLCVVLHYWRLAP